MSDINQEEELYKKHMQERHIEEWAMREDGFTEEFINLYKTFSFEELKAYEDDLLKNDLLSILAIVNIEPVYFFYRLTANQKKDWFEKIHGINFESLLRSKVSRESRTKVLKWFRQFFILYDIEVSRKPELGYHSSIEEQLFLLKVLEKNGLLNLKQWAPTSRKLAPLLSILLNRSTATTKTQYDSVSHANTKISIVRLRALKKAFEIAGLEDNKGLIDNEIKKATNKEDSKPSKSTKENPK